MAHGRQLPTETLHSIFLHCNSHDLATLSLNSQYFNAVAERALYISVDICEILSANNPYPERSLRWCQSLLLRSHLFTGVKKLRLKWQSDPESPPRMSLDHVCVMLNRVLPNLTHLEVLDLPLGPANVLLVDGPRHAIERVVDHCCFPRLHSCTLGADWTKGCRFYSSILPRFLATLSQLHHLKLTDCRLLSPELLLGALPELVSFRGTPIAAAALLPDRPVQILGLCGQDAELTAQVLSQLILTTTPLRSLDLSAISLRPATLRTVASHFPHLERIRVRLALRHTLHYALSGIRLLTGLSSVLTSFTALSLLDLSPTMHTGYGHVLSEDERALCVEWSRACPALRQVIFPSRSTWTWSGADEMWDLVM
ncbi:hypothetical protein DL96DRAFT_1667308 [Flagelloscypha sp. PMI_526]|nr:hypothetical protein DL96DRAFT_1667308 [Flagelloscypha sp. PMI_526]